MLSGLGVRNNLIDLAPLQGNLMTFVLNADDKLLREVFHGNCPFRR